MGWFVSDLVNNFQERASKIYANQANRSSAGLGLSTFATGMLGPLYFNLTFAKTVGIIFGAGLLGSAVSGYCAIFGKKHGLRALANSRYSFGYYGAMAMAVLNIITEGVFGIQMGILGGQALNVLSKGTLPVAGAIPIVLLSSWLIATGGWKFIHYWSRYDVFEAMSAYYTNIGCVGLRSSSPLWLPLPCMLLQARCSAIVGQKLSIVLPSQGSLFRSLPSFLEARLVGSLCPVSEYQL